MECGLCVLRYLAHIKHPLQHNIAAVVEAACLCKMIALFLRWRYSGVVVITVASICVVLACE